jgi:hypothetical protein
LWQREALGLCLPRRSSWEKSLRPLSDAIAELRVRPEAREIPLVLVLLRLHIDAWAYCVAGGLIIPGPVATRP